MDIQKFINEITLSVFAKIILSIVALFGGTRLFVFFVKRAFLKYFDSIENGVGELKAAIYGTKDNPKEGIEHRLTVVETKCEERGRSGECIPKKRSRG